MTLLLSATDQRRYATVHDRLPPPAFTYTYADALRDGVVKRLQLVTLAPTAVLVDGTPHAPASLDRRLRRAVCHSPRCAARLLEWALDDLVHFRARTGVPWQLHVVTDRVCTLLADATAAVAQRHCPVLGRPLTADGIHSSRTAAVTTAALDAFTCCQTDVLLTHRMFARAADHPLIALTLNLLPFATADALAQCVVGRSVRDVDTTWAARMHPQHTRFAAALDALPRPLVSRVLECALADNERHYATALDTHADQRLVESPSDAWSLVTVPPPPPPTNIDDDDDDVAPMECTSPSNPPAAATAPAPLPLPLPPAAPPPPPPPPSPDPHKPTLDLHLVRVVNTRVYCHIHRAYHGDGELGTAGSHTAAGGATPSMGVDTLLAQTRTIFGRGHTLTLTHDQLAGALWRYAAPAFCALDARQPATLLVATLRHAALYAPEAFERGVDHGTWRVHL